MVNATFTLFEDLVTAETAISYYPFRESPAEVAALLDDLEQEITRRDQSMESSEPWPAPLLIVLRIFAPGDRLFRRRHTFDSTRAFEVDQVWDDSVGFIDRLAVGHKVSPRAASAAGARVLVLVSARPLFAVRATGNSVSIRLMTTHGCWIRPGHIRWPSH